MEGARPATEADLPRLAELARVAIARAHADEGRRGVGGARRVPEPVEESLARDLADPGIRLIVGTIDVSPSGTRRFTSRTCTTARASA